MDVREENLYSRPALVLRLPCANGLSPTEDKEREEKGEKGERGPI